jgi:predicted O-methyltransferase YrrM
MYPDIIIPTLKDPHEVAPMMCAIQGFSQGCKVIPTCTKTSAAKNRNIGLDRSKADIVIMLDDDVSGFYDGWYMELIEPLLKDPDIVYVTANLVQPNGDLSYMMFRPEGTGVHDIPRAPTAAVAFRNNGLRFDEKYVGSGFEDDDFCAQLSEKYPKGRFVINKDVKLVHANEEKGRRGTNFSINEKYFNSKWETIGNKRIRQGTIIPWKERIALMPPDSLREVPEKAVYDSSEDLFTKAGFTREIFERLFPIMEQQVWSDFSLFCLAKKVPAAGTILEIGSGRGGSISTIALANPTAKLINIDKFSAYDETSAFGTVKDYKGFKYEDFARNVEPFGVLPRLKTIKKWSHEAVNDIPDKSCDMIFIDGNHSYEPCKQDLKDYLPKLKSGGIFCGHDYHPIFPGVIKAVKEAYGDKYDVMDNSSIWVKL